MNVKKKIIVIADDFTGAAEIGGIGLRHGMNVIIETEPIDNAEADILVVATDTRSMNREEASKYISDLTSELMKLNPQFIFKKIDSVFRGNISDELIAQMEIMKKNRSIIIAANPEFNRIIKDGKYFIDGIPLDQTCFSSDSQYPVKNAEVLALLSNVKNYPVFNLKADNELPERGLIIGDVENVDDLGKWAVQFNDSTLFAGASGFFDSLLLTLPLVKSTVDIPAIPFGEHALFVLGSSYPKDTALLVRMIENGHFISNMPKEIFYNTKFSSYYQDAWVNDIVTGILNFKKVIMASMHEKSAEPGLSFRIKNIVAEVVKKVSERVNLNEILIEGGSTTSEILKHMNIKRLKPIRELDTGVIRMNVEGIKDLCITTKPGSYLWPKNVWLPSEIESFNKQKIEFLK